jgi:hypothetical protein
MSPSRFSYAVNLEPTCAVNKDAVSDADCPRAVPPVRYFSSGLPEDRPTPERHPRRYLRGLPENPENIDE